MAVKPGPGRIIGWILKGMLYSAVISVCLFFMWRVFISDRIPKEIDRLAITDSLVKAYEEKNGDLHPFRQLQDTITRGKENQGYFSVVKYDIIPEANQIQIVFRYNNSTLRRVAADYDLSSVPDRESDPFEVTLVKTRDLTPDEKNDDGNPETREEIRYRPSKTVKAKTRLYNYRRFVFENISVESDDIGIFADIYYVGDIDYGKDAYGALCIYDNVSERKEYVFSAGEKERIAKAEGTERKK